jgi:hypothetical protein
VINKGHTLYQKKARRFISARARRASGQDQADNHQHARSPAHSGGAPTRSDATGGADPSERHRPGGQGSAARTQLRTSRVDTAVRPRNKIGVLPETKVSHLRLRRPQQEPKTRNHHLIRFGSSISAREHRRPSPIQVSLSSPPSFPNFLSRGNRALLDCTVVFRAGFPFGFVKFGLVSLRIGGLSLETLSREIDFLEAIC